VFLSAKRTLTENLNPEKVKKQFPIREIENEAAMVSYISVLSYDEKLDFTSDSREFFVNEYYCLKSDCNHGDQQRIREVDVLAPLQAGGVHVGGSGASSAPGSGCEACRGRWTSLPVVPLSLCRWVGPVRVCFLLEIFS